MLFFDNLIHISDNIQESKRTLDTINEYEKFTVGNYLRRGYEAVIKGNKKQQSKSYASFLKEMKEDNDERG